MMGELMVTGCGERVLTSIEGALFPAGVHGILYSDMLCPIARSEKNRQHPFVQLEFGNSEFFLQFTSAHSRRSDPFVTHAKSTWPDILKSQEVRTTFKE
jgi:hypothetical protein